MEKDMTAGTPGKIIFNFTMPIFIGNIFQQFYNMADTVIVGKFVGNAALAAVGACGTLVFLIIGFLQGVTAGFTVVTAQHFGAGNMKAMKKSVASGAVLTGIVTVILTLLSMISMAKVLHLMNTPSDMYGEAYGYIMVICGGIVAQALYNYLASVLRALGDSKRPLYFLVIAAFLNIVLDLVFVIVFHWGVAGVAWATFLAQGAACILALFALKKRMQSIPAEGEIELFSWGMLRRISTVAIPSILQQSFISVGNLFIQSLVNSFGSSVIAGYSAAVKLNTFTITSLTTLGNGLSSFTAQNIGAGKADRVKKGFRAGLGMGLFVASVFLVIYWFFTEPVIHIFMEETGGLAMETGVEFLKIVSPFYLVVMTKLIADGVLRGAGCMKQFMIATFTDLILRVILSYILAVPMGAAGIWLSWPIGWSIAAVLSIGFYLQGGWKKSGLV